MGSEQSQLQQQTGEAGGTIRGGSLRAQSSNATPTPSRSSTASGAKLLRGNTIAVAEISALNLDDYAGPSSTGTPSSAYICDSRPVSPPMSVCSDSDLPYISYTDKPIGDSPKLRNKQQAKSGKIRPSSVIVGRSQEAIRSAGGIDGGSAMLVGRQQRPYSSTTSSSGAAGGGGGGGSTATGTTSSTRAHNIVVVKSAAVKETGIEKDDDIVRLQSVPMFLPVMRGTLSLPANRDPEVLERLHPNHMINMCSRLQSHFNTCATQVASEQQQITNKIKEVDQEISSALAQLVQKQKLYTSYAETFSKVRVISQQLTRCNDILNQNIESMEYLNNLLDVDDRLEPFVWKTE